MESVFLFSVLLTPDRVEMSWTIIDFCVFVISGKRKANNLVGSVCTICGVTVRPVELPAHFAIEIEKLNKITRLVTRLSSVVNTRLWNAKWGLILELDWCLASPSLCYFKNNNDKKMKVFTNRFLMIIDFTAFVFFWCFLLLLLDQ